VIYRNFEEFVRELAPGRPIIGLDLGTKTIGIAISDVGLRIATPYYTIRRKDQKKDFGRIWQLATERDVCGVVIGMPTNMDGSDGPRSQSTRAFARSLEMYMPRPVTFWDERLSTVAAERALIEAGTSRAKRELVIDKVAAAVILQGALDRIAFLYGGRDGDRDVSAAPEAARDTASDAASGAPESSGPEKAASPAMDQAGRARGGRALPRARAEADPADARKDENTAEAPKRDADAVRRRRMMTRRLDRDE